MQKRREILLRMEVIKDLILRRKEEIRNAAEREFFEEISRLLDWKREESVIALINVIIGISLIGEPDRKKLASPALDEPGTSASSSSHTPDNINIECSNKMDNSLYKNKWLSGTEKLPVLENLWAPSSNYKFPAITHGKQERKFLYSRVAKV
ncbi:hypothetical protein JTE90_025685 [Oedothorax gibbosus]|uniref:Uncharacterized protein n=1 Tax=Oedothorax gibbosus TaxID=931172 RepID=A0AAV6UBV4_9ARAC|nr:hypothetical protein JTE90_025685 [Oedothorax gibbosus]